MSPGAWWNLNRNPKVVGEHPKNTTDDGVNPHGISVRPEVNLRVAAIVAHNAKWPLVVHDPESGWEGGDVR